MSVTRACTICGYSHTYASDALANVHFARHSCEKQRRLVASAQRRAARAAGGIRRDCPHPGHPHQHGTRTAYVKDECRCRPCMDANTAASSTASRQRSFGRWQPYVDADPVRQHIAALRDHDVGLTQIAKLARTSLSHVRALVSVGPDGRPTTRRVRPTTAERILAIEPGTASSAPSARVDATGTRRRLLALMAIDWPLAELAARLGRSPSSLARSLDRPKVNAETARQVADLYDQLWNQLPPRATAGQRAASAKARSVSQQQGGRPPLDWDDIDNDPDPDPGPSPSSSQAQVDADIDEIAIERAVAGDGIRLEHLNAAEQAEAVRRLTERGKSIRDIAAQLATTTRTVSRRRTAISAA